MFFYFDIEKTCRILKHANWHSTDITTRTTVSHCLATCMTPQGTFTLHYNKLEAVKRLIAKRVACWYSSVFVKTENTEPALTSNFPVDVL